MGSRIHRADLTTLDILVGGDALSDEIIIQIHSPEGTTSRHRVTSNDGRVAFPFVGDVAGEYLFEIKASGAHSISERLFVTEPKPWQLPDSFEPDDRAEAAIDRGHLFSGTFHTSEDVDWLLLPVREGFATRLRIRSEVEVQIGGLPKAG